MKALLCLCPNMVFFPPPTLRTLIYAFFTIVILGWRFVILHLHLSYCLSNTAYPTAIQCLHFCVHMLFKSNIFKLNSSFFHMPGLPTTHLSSRTICFSSTGVHSAVQQEAFSICLSLFSLRKSSLALYSPPSLSRLPAERGLRKSPESANIRYQT